MRFLYTLIEYLRLHVWKCVRNVPHALCTARAHGSLFPSKLPTLSLFLQFAMTCVVPCVCTILRGHDIKQIFVHIVAPILYKDNWIQIFIDRQFCLLLFLHSKYFYSNLFFHDFQFLFLWNFFIINCELIQFWILLHSLNSYSIIISIILPNQPGKSIVIVFHEKMLSCSTHSAITIGNIYA